MTKVGYTDIEDRIRQLPIKVPDNMTSTELTNWLLGYNSALSNIMGLLNKMEDEEGRLI